jgi:hypothetical protein
VLNDRQLKSGSGCPDPRGPSNEESGCVMIKQNAGRQDGAKSPDW